MDSVCGAWQSTDQVTGFSGFISLLEKGNVDLILNVL